ncbi:MAG TPA: tRNA epoxyqueuosine(34) reductase QueG [Bacteroidetes bacterium]|nr:tRNA epoxyqueuosine(34) reductase QueG [Bacteroidota bacterium]
MHNQEERSKKLKSLAKKEGFDLCGISRASFLENEADKLEKWLNKNYNGQMNYMSNHFDKRLDPRKLMPGARSVISLLYNYYTPIKQKDKNAPKISTYAYGEDYHFIIKRKLKELFKHMKEEFGDINARVFVDSAPILEKAWAERSGLGWIGKHTNLINKKKGSFFFLAEIITDLELAPDSPVTDHCGSCTMCIDACPTDAIIAPYVLDGSRCISYFTIELKDQIPNEFKGSFNDWMFGCDICQDVCPWNSFSKPHSEPLFEPKEELINMSKNEWKELTKETFRKVFKGSAVKRTKFEGLKRNIRFLDQ